MSLDDRYLVGPVRKALQLLDVLTGAGQALTLSQVADRAGLPKTTAFRYLYTLRAARLVAEADGAYAPGPRLAVPPDGDALLQRLADAAMPEMQRLRHRFNETVNLAVADADGITYVAMVGSTRSLRMEAAMGTRDPLHSTSLGKAILAARLPARRLDGLPARLVRRTAATMATRPALEAELARTAERGYALDLQENELGAHCVAAAVPTDRVAAALSISGPVQRLPPEALDRCGVALVRAAAVVAGRLG